jgi:hypothetical protein
MKLITVISFFISTYVFADAQLRDISKKDVENISKEFGVNFSHTTVAAPETNGLWGFEVGIVAGQTNAPKFSDVIENSGGDSENLDKFFNAGLMARIHIPFELFFEATILPETEVTDITFKSNSYAVGWNFGRSMRFPFDLVLGYNRGTGELDFTQEAQDLDPKVDINFKTKTQIYWVGLSKTFLFITPYLKLGSSRIDGELDASADIFGYQAGTSESTKTTGGYFAAGLNVQLLLLRLGIETSQTQDVKRISGKLSISI